MKFQLLKSILEKVMTTPSPWPLLPAICVLLIYRWAENGWDCFNLLVIVIMMIGMWFVFFKSSWFGEVLDQIMKYSKNLLFSRFCLEVEMEESVVSGERSMSKDIKDKVLDVLRNPYVYWMEQGEGKRQIGNSGSGGNNGFSGKIITYINNQFFTMISNFFTKIDVEKNRRIQIVTFWKIDKRVIFQ